MNRSMKWTAAVLAVGGILGWLAASGPQATASAQENAGPAADQSAYATAVAPQKPTLWRDGRMGAETFSGCIVI